MDQLSIATSFDIRAGDYYAMVMDSYYLENTLFRYRISDSSMTQVALPYLFNTYNLTTMEYDADSAMLFATFHNMLVLVNQGQGNYKQLWQVRRPLLSAFIASSHAHGMIIHSVSPLMPQLFKASDYVSLQISAYDLDKHQYYLILSSPLDAARQCNYILGTSIITADITISPCIPKDVDTAPERLLSLYNYRPTTLIALIRNSLGTQIISWDTLRGNQS
jgi:hypothetical protein